MKTIDPIRSGAVAALLLFVSSAFGQVQPVNESASGKNENNETIKGFSLELVDEGFWPSMEVEPDGRAHLIYFKNGHLLYATKTRNGAWHKKPLGMFTGCRENDVLIDKDGNVQIVLWTINDDVTPISRLYHGTLTKSGQWIIKIIATSLGFQGFHSLSLKADNKNELHLTYLNVTGTAEPGTIMEMHRKGTTWSKPAAFSSGYDCVDMAVDKGNNMQVSFYAIGTGFGYMKKNISGTWSDPENPEPGWKGAQLEGMETSIFTDEYNNPHISYAGQVNNDGREDIKYAWKSNDKWYTSMVDEGTFMSASNKIVIDPDGKAHLSYFHKRASGFVFDLRYATNITGKWIRQDVAKDIGAEYNVDNLDMGEDQDEYIHIVYSGTNSQHTKEVHYALQSKTDHFNIDPEILDFTAVKPGEEKNLAMKLINPLAKNIIVDQIELSDARISLDKTSFTISSLATETVNVTFRQTDALWKDNYLRIWYSSGLFIDVLVKATSWSPVLTVDPNPIQFGQVPLNNLVIKTVKLTNTGKTDLIISDINVKITGPFGQIIYTDFLLVGHNCTTLEPDETCEVQISYKPLTDKDQTSCLNITSNDPAASLKKITITGGTPYAQIACESNINFGYCPLTQSVTKKLTLKNVGSQVLAISGPTFYGTDNSQFSVVTPCTSILPGESCDMEIRMTPTRVADLTATMLITSNSRSSGNAYLTLTGSSLLRKLELSNTSIDFGEVRAGEQKSELLELRNTGSNSITISGIQLTGNDINDFGKDHQCTTIAAGALCSGNVLFTPLSEGDKSASLVVLSNDSNNPSQTVTIKGTALAYIPLEALISADHMVGAAPLEVKFQAAITGGKQPYSYLWDFDDLQSSTDASPGHTFTAPGSYNVMLQLTDNDNATLCITININVLASNVPSLAGQLWDETGSNEVLKSTVILYPAINITNTTQKSLNGVNSFLFTGLTAGSYTVQAVPDVIMYPDELPTYLGDKLTLFEATWVNVTGIVTGKDIRLVKKPSPPPGPGTIQGNIVSGSKKGLTITEKSGDIKGDPVQNTFVYLKRTSDGMLIGYDISGSDGSFSFPGLESGSYYFVADCQGKPMDAANGLLIISDARKNIEILATVKSDKITVVDIATGTEDVNIPNLKVYPVPAGDHLVIEIPEGTFKGKMIRLSIIDLSGRYVFVDNKFELTGSPVMLNISRLKGGIYLLQAGDKTISRRVKIVKMR